MLTLAASCAANRPATQQPLAPASGDSNYTVHRLDHSNYPYTNYTNYTVHRLNELFEAGHPSNSVARAGLVVHQHDNTEGWDAAIYRPQTDSGFAERWSTSLVSRLFPGTYNEECGIIIDPSSVRVLCSYYHDMVSWSSGCASVNTRMDQPPSKPSEVPYSPDKLKDMLEMSSEIQLRNHSAATKELWRRGNGEPNTGEASFWQGKYNEVVIDGKYYTASLPRAVAAVFYVEGGDSDGPACAERTRSAIMEKYGVDERQLPIVIYSRGANSTHAFSLPPSPKQVPVGATPDCPVCKGGNCCFTGASWANTCNGPAHDWDEGWAACNCDPTSQFDPSDDERCVFFGFGSTSPKATKPASLEPIEI